ncbi:hypothetical protein QL093DRAFT_2197748 [Fusarium oxysporum]|nr:hypothetical protein QL093DRAFT_2197748 [Fusarium oxysporum]
MLSPVYPHLPDTAAPFCSFCLLILRLVSFHPEPCPSPLCSNIPRCRCLRASSPATMALPCCRPW